MIELRNDGAGFGFGISGSRNSGAVVRNIFPGGAADRVSTKGIIFFSFVLQKFLVKIFLCALNDFSSTFSFHLFYFYEIENLTISFILL